MNRSYSALTMTMILETKHLLIREFDESDLDALHAITGDPDVIRYVEANLYAVQFL